MNAPYDPSKDPGALATRLLVEEDRCRELQAQIDRIWNQCHIIYWPKDVSAYPIEHNPMARKYARAMIEAALNKDLDE